MPISAYLPTLPYYSTAFISFHLCVNFLSNIRHRILDLIHIKNPSHDPI